jgi:RNAse (barnase) inhibitor barstar
MPTVELNGAAITDAESFHIESARAFGFPDSYPHTMDSWVDCLSYLRDEDGMSSIRLKPDETLHIVVTHSAALRERAEDVLEEMAFCIIGINERYEDYGEKPALELELR